MRLSRLLAAVLLQPLVPTLCSCGALIGIEDVAGGREGTSGSVGAAANEVPVVGPPCRACGDACVDPLTDGDNCGRCGTRCATGERCLAGVCGRRLHSSPSATSACLMGEDGVLRCWGENRHGQLGRGTISAVEPVPSPQLVPALYGVSDGLAVCSLDAVGAVRCVGGNQWGNLGNGKYGGSEDCEGSPTCELTATIAVLPGPADEIVAGGGDETIGYTCARLSDRSLSCWGRGADRAIPTPRLRNVAQITSGNAFVCALSFDGRGVFFGAFLGVAGGPTLREGLPTPSLMELPPAELLVASARGICVSRGPSLTCFGSNARGQIGIGATTPPDLRPAADVPLPVDPTDGSARDLVQLTAGAAHVCVLQDTGRVLCWGAADAVGAGAQPAEACMDGPCHPAPVVVLEDVREIAAGLSYTLAIKRDGTVWGWGRPDPDTCVLVRDRVCATNGFTTPEQLFSPLLPLRPSSSPRSPTQHQRAARASSSVSYTSSDSARTSLWMDGWLAGVGLGLGGSSGKLMQGPAVASPAVWLPRSTPKRNGGTGNVENCGCGRA